MPHPVDLFVGEGHHRGHGHRSASAGKPLVCLLAEYLSKMRDSFIEFGNRGCRRWTDGCEATDDRRRLVVAATVEQRHEKAERRADLRDAARVEVVTDSEPQ